LVSFFALPSREIRQRPPARPQCIALEAKFTSPIFERAAPHYKQNERGIKFPLT
jgi:hypothetical protein